MDVSYISLGLTKGFFVPNSSTQRSLGIPVTTEIDGRRWAVLLGGGVVFCTWLTPSTQTHAGKSSRKLYLLKQLTSVPVIISASDAKL